MTKLQDPCINEELLSKFDVPGPRYTSYPTADRFNNGFGEQDWLNALTIRGENFGLVGGKAGAGPLSIYIHIPFCESLCYYCACNKIITKKRDKSVEYLNYLYKEIDLTLKSLGPAQTVSQLHLGGGSPTFLSDQQLTQLFDFLRSRFKLLDTGEYAIEVDPRTINVARLHALKAIGFNRLSFGVQDFDEKVQKAVHRVQPFEQVNELMIAARELGFKSINVDLIYGLPLQSPASFDKTLEQVVAIAPDRIALYAYAHLPQRFKPQRRIADHQIPPANDKLSMLSRSLDYLQKAGYVYVGMDHFAKATDPLAIAKRQGRLHRNFQGYSTQPDCDLLALGVSSISKMGGVYSQNVKTLEEYYDLLDQEVLPVEKGLLMTRDDLIRREVIMALMCHGSLVFESINLAYLIDSKNYFAKELKDLEHFVNDGLLQMDDSGLQVTTMGWYFVRGIAMVFDKYLQVSKDHSRFSKIL